VILIHLFRANCYVNINGKQEKSARPKSYAYFFAESIIFD